MAAAKKPGAIVQWWLDKQADLERQLTLARKSTSQCGIERLERSIERIDVMLKDMKQ